VVSSFTCCDVRLIVCFRDSFIYFSSNTHKEKISNPLFLSFLFISKRTIALHMVFENGSMGSSRFIAISAMLNLIVFFQLCSISLFLSIIMLLTRKFFLFEITYFLGIGGALQAMLTPELAYDFPHYRYFHFFLAHIAIILASLYMIWYENCRPAFTSIWKAFAALNVIAIVVFFINKATGGNYMFLARKPINPSLIDFLGPYPWYILSLEIVALFMFFILYLPFIRKKN